MRKTTMTADAEPSNDTNLDELVIKRRSLAIATDATGGASAGLGAVWADLVAGHLKVSDSFTHAQRSYLVLQRLTRGRAHCAMKFSTFQRVATSGSFKVVAMELGCSLGTITLHTQYVLGSLGLRGRWSSTPGLLLLAACASCGMRLERPIRVTEARDDANAFVVVGADRLDVSIAVPLSPSERDVVRRLLEGGNRSEIALARRTSIRTVSNQLSAVFRKLHVSGRLDLIHALALADRSGAEHRISA